MKGSRLAPAAVFFIALALRLAYLAEAHGSPFFVALGLDAKYYDDEALRILAGTLPREPFFMGPLYSYFLAAVYAVLGHSYDAVRVLQAVMGAVTALLAWGIASRLAGPTAALLAGLLVATYPPLVFYAGSILYPTLAALLDAAAVYFLIEHARTRGARPLAAAGLALGLSAVGQATLLAAAPGVLVWLWFLERRSFPRAARRAAPFLAALAVAIAPLTAHNLIHGKEPVLLTSNGGLNFYIGNGPEATGGYVKPKGLDVYEDPSGRRLLSRREGRALSARETDRAWMRAGQAEVFARPKRFLALLVRKTAFYWGAIEIPQIECFEFQKRESGLVTFLDGLPLTFGLLGPLSGVGVALVVARARRRPALAARAAPPLFVAALYSATIIVFFVISRYRLPMLPILLPFAGCALAAGGALARDAARGASRVPIRPLAAAAGLLALLSLAINANPYHVSKTSGFGQCYYRLAIIARQNGRLDEAEAQYRKAMEFDGDYAPARVNIAELLLAKGDESAALVQLEEAVRLDPDYWRARYNLGLAHAQQGKWSSAATEFEEASRLAPQAPEVWFGVGAARFCEGDWARAHEAFTKMAGAAGAVQEQAARAGSLDGLVAREERLETAAGPPPAGGEPDPDGSAGRVSARAAALWSAIGETELARRALLRFEWSKDPVMQYQQGAFLVSEMTRRTGGSQVEIETDSDFRQREWGRLLGGALAARPALPFAHFYLGAAALRRNDPETALREFLLETRNAPDNAEALYNVGILQLEFKKDPAAAAKALSACAALGGEKSAEARDILRRIGSK